MADKAASSGVVENGAHVVDGSDESGSQAASEDGHTKADDRPGRFWLMLLALGSCCQKLFNVLGSIFGHFIINAKEDHEDEDNFSETDGHADEGTPLLSEVSILFQAAPNRFWADDALALQNNGSSNGAQCNKKYLFLVFPVQQQSSSSIVPQRPLQSS